MIKYFAAVLIFLVSGSSHSQDSKWENFTDFKSVTSIAFDSVSGNIYCSSRGGLFVVQNSSGAVLKKYTNLDGLININLTSLAIDNRRRLWIGSSDGSISILDLASNSWRYIFDIKNSTESNKIIYKLLPEGNFMFVATGYGIHKISVSSLNFVDAPYYKLGSFPINTTIYSLATKGDVLYAATKAGVAWANYASANLNNPSSWSNYNNAPLNAEVRAVESAGDFVFAGSDAGFMYNNGSVWQSYPNGGVSSLPIKDIRRFRSGFQDMISFIAGSGIFTAPVNSLSQVSPYLSAANYSVLAVNSNQQIIAGLNDNGIILEGISEYIFPNGPFTNVFSQIVIDDLNEIWAAGGLGTNGFYKFDGSRWENYNLASHPEIGSTNWFQKMVYGNGTVWALGFGGGPTRIVGDSIVNFNPSNSPLPGIPENPNFCVPYGGTYDNQGVLWITFFRSNSGRSLYAYSGDQWIGFSNPSFISSSILSQADVDSYNTKWIVSGGARSGVYFFNENGTLTNTSDDIFGFYDISEFGSEVTNISFLIVEKNNEVWITTNNGVFIIANPLGAIQNPAAPPRPQKLGIISGNLRVPFTENCVTIAHDVLNDKWIGTESNGVFHLSSDGTTLIEQLNTSKTPLLADKINTIAVNPQNGKAYFGTQNGLSSYQTDAVEPLVDFDKLKIMPNPFVTPTSVSLKIDGLVEGSLIKIMTISGEVFAEFESPGGRIASWNGLNSKGEYAPSGVYIVVAYNKDGSKVGKGKVAIVKKQ